MALKTLMFSLLLAATLPIAGAQAASGQRENMPNYPGSRFWQNQGDDGKFIGPTGIEATENQGPVYEYNRREPNLKSQGSPQEMNRQQSFWGSSKEDEDHDKNGQDKNGYNASKRNSQTNFQSSRANQTERQRQQSYMDPEENEIHDTYHKNGNGNDQHPMNSNHGQPKNGHHTNGHPNNGNSKNGNHSKQEGPAPFKGYQTYKPKTSDPQNRSFEQKNLPSTQQTDKTKTQKNQYGW